MKKRVQFFLVVCLVLLSNASQSCRISIIPNSTSFTSRLLFDISVTCQSEILPSYTVLYTLDGSNPYFSATVCQYTKPVIIDSTVILNVCLVFSGGVKTPIENRVYTLMSPLPSPQKTSYKFTLLSEESSKIIIKPSCCNFSDSLTVKDHCSRAHAEGDIAIMEPVIASVYSGICVGKIPPVHLSCATDSAMILYTLDGSVPRVGSSLYNGKALNLIAPAHLRMRAFRDGFTSGAVTERKYDYAVLPTPVTNVSNGTLFSDTLQLQFKVPGFEEDTELIIYYTLDGSDPLIDGLFYDEKIALTSDANLKTVAVRSGYYDSKIGEYEYFSTVRVISSVYVDDKNDGTIDLLHISFDKKPLDMPSVIELRDPYTSEIFLIKNAYFKPLDRPNCFCYELNISGLFDGYGNFENGHYGRIPLPGEFDTAPFLISTKDNSCSVEDSYFNECLIAVLNNPFIPVVSPLPEKVQDICGYSHLTGTAVVVTTLHPSKGSASVYDALGNQLICREDLIEDPLTGKLYLVWDGRDKLGRIVATGTYLVIIILQEKQNGSVTAQNATIGVTAP